MVTMLTTSCFILAALLGFFTSFTVSQLDTDGLVYLAKYGYIEKDDQTSGSLRSQEFIMQAIMQFQKMAGIDVTGVVNAETRQWMGKPRCGVSDKMGNSDAARKKRYALHGSKWGHTDLTYRISRVTSKLETGVIERELQRAFDVWDKHTPLTFTRKEYGSVDIDIQFASGHHGDNNPFDGPGQTLAHAFFPKYGGDAHFDDDERFTHESEDGINLFQVAAHEFGHSLGLAHSDTRDSLMAPFYQGYQTSFELNVDDIAAIQELYGRKLAPDATTRKTVVKPTRGSIINIPDICRLSTIDAITMTEDGTTYVFREENYYRLNAYGIDQGYPKTIAHDWKGVKGPIDAALTWENGFTYIFQGENYWKYENLRYIYGPRRIFKGFSGVPDNIDTAFVWSGNGKTYFMKDDEYWRYSGNSVDFGYPKSLSVWRGIPTKVNAVFQWENGRTYFFIQDNYYRYNDKDFNVDSSYPRQTSVWWLGCPDKEQIIQYDKDQVAGSSDQQLMVIVNSETDSSDDQWLEVNDNNGSIRLRISFLLVVICLPLLILL